MDKSRLLAVGTLLVVFLSGSTLPSVAFGFVAIPNLDTLATTSFAPGSAERLVQADSEEEPLEFGEEEEIDTSEYLEEEMIDQDQQTVSGPAEETDQPAVPEEVLPEPEYSEEYWLGEGGLYGEPLEATPEAAPEVEVQHVMEPPAQQIAVTARGGYGRFTESTVDQAAEVLSVGLEFQWYPKTWLGLFVPFLADAYQRLYRAEGAGGGSGLPLIEEEEWRFDTGAVVAFDALEKAGYGEGWLYIGGRYFYFFNDSFAEHIAGAVAGALFDLPVTQDLSVRAFGDYTYNLLSLMDEDDEGLRSVTGRPISSLRFGGGLALAVGSTSSFSIIYRGEHLPYDHTDLLIHRALLETSVSFSF